MAEQFLDMSAGNETVAADGFDDADRGFGGVNSGLDALNELGADRVCDRVGG